MSKEFPRIESLDSYEVNINLPTLEERKEVACRFIDSLPSKPIKWSISGSTRSGKFRADSDVDIDALYEQNDDVPYDNLFKRQDPKNGLIDGCIDFHYFSRDALVYKVNPDLLEEFERSLTNLGT